MQIYTWFFENKELLKLAYGMIITIICLIIVLKTNRLFKLSMHKGIRYFRNAFFFYGIGFVIRYFLGAVFAYGYLPLDYAPAINIVFEFFLIMAGFFLLYSLLWKKFEPFSGADYRSSLFNSYIAIFYLITIIIVFMDYLWRINYLMFFSQIILFAFATIISFVNCKNKGKKRKFLKFYFAAMVLSLVAWTLNFLAAVYFEWNKALLANIYTINIVIFLLFLYGIVRVTKYS